MEIRSEQVVYKLLLLFIFGATGLVLEHDIIVPAGSISKEGFQDLSTLNSPSLDTKVFRIEQRITASNIKLALFLILCSLLGLLLRPLFCSFFLDFFQFHHQSEFFIFIVVPKYSLAFVIVFCKSKHTPRRCFHHLTLPSPRPSLVLPLVSAAVVSLLSLLQCHRHRHSPVYACLVWEQLPRLLHLV